MLALLAAPLALAGCPDWTAYLGGDCGSLVGMEGDPQLSRPGCPGDDAGADGGEGCECVQVPGNWFGPTWLWYGLAEQAPSCEGESFFEGYTDFIGGGACEICTCEPSTGSCALPSQLSVSTEACNLPGGSVSTFDAPVTWDGQCDGTTSVPAGVAYSLTIAPLVMNEDGCNPGPPVPAKVIPARPATLARACHGEGWTVCGDVISSACIPHAEQPRPGFRLCIMKNGDNDCPANVSFTEKHMFYDRADEACADCGCGPPVGSACKAMLSIYEDGVCAGPLVDQVSVSSVSPKCLDIQPPGQGLGSKSAAPPVYLPGACEPTGGQATGVITGINPTTLCCRP
jgi:hypothetical protein